MALDPVGGILTGLARYQAHRFGADREKAKEQMVGRIIIESEELAAGYVQLPRYILSDKNLSPTAKICFATLLHYAWQEASCYPGINNFCEFLGISNKPVIKALKELESGGFIEIKKWGQGLNNTYFLPKKAQKT